MGGRIQPPIPDYSCEGDFHYAYPDVISSGEITGTFSLEAVYVVDTSTGKRDEFCSRKKMDELVSSCGNPELGLKYEKSDESVSVHASVTDANDTLAKMLVTVDEFVSKYTGEDLRNTVVIELKRRYNGKSKHLFQRRQMQLPEQSKRQKRMMIMTGKSSLYNNPSYSRILIGSRL